MKGQDFREAAEKHCLEVCGAAEMAAITKLTYQAKEITKFCLDDFTAGAEHGYSEAKKEVREWIPVSERLPEVDETVQAWNRKWKLAKRRLVGDTTLWHYEGDTLYTYDAPTHWMPLPEPPKSLASFTEQEQKENETR